MGHSFPWLVDSALCTGVILHGIFTSKPEFNSFLVSLPGVRNLEVRLNFMYLVAGYYSYLSSLALAPFRVFYAMTAIGFTSFALMILQRWNREKGEAHFGSRKHSHRHWLRHKHIHLPSVQVFCKAPCTNTGHECMQVVYEGGMCCAHDSSNHNFAIRTVTRKQATLFGGVTCNVKRRLCCDIYRMTPPFFFLGRGGFFLFVCFPYTIETFLRLLFGGLMRKTSLPYPWILVYRVHGRNTDWEFNVQNFLLYLIN